MPRRVSTALPALLLAIALGMLSACSEGTYPEYFSQRYVIEVDSLYAPASLTAGDTLEVLFWGYVGPNSCHAFEGFETELATHQVDLTLWTKYFRRTNHGCAEELVYLEGEPYRVGPLPAGPYVVVVHQPDGSLLERTVDVADAAPR
jgi:hypothetical protein